MQENQCHRYSVVYIWAHKCVYIIASICASGTYIWNDRYNQKANALEYIGNSSGDNRLRYITYIDGNAGSYRLGLSISGYVYCVKQYTYELFKKGKK